VKSAVGIFHPVRMPRPFSAVIADSSVPTSRRSSIVNIVEDHTDWVTIFGNMKPSVLRAKVVTTKPNRVPNKIKVRRFVCALYLFKVVIVNKMEIRM